MRATEYAGIVAGLLSAVDPRVAGLVQAAQTLDNAVDTNAASIDQAIRDYQQRLEAIKDDLIDRALDMVPIEELTNQAKQTGLMDAYQLHAEATLGPLFLSVTSPAARLADPRGGALIAIGPMPPDTFQAKLEAGPVKGNGALRVTDTGVAGVISASIGVIEVAALASLARTPEGGPSFLAVFAAGFTPGLQFGFGFQISRIGGLVGVERAIDRDAMAAKLREGTLAAVLFPLDIGPSATAALIAVDQLFPPRDGSAVMGPTFRLSWLEVAGAGFASVDLAVLIQLPGPVIALVGSVRAGIPAVVQIRADILGVLDFPARTATVDASLVDSGVLGILTIYGDLAFAISWGASPYTVLSLGGFYPGFSPEPAKIRPLNRLGMALDVPIPGLTFRAEGYLAATSNTLQFGGRLEVGIDAGIASASGYLGLDAIIQFTPFHINADVVGGLEVKFLGHTFAGVRFEGQLDGPGPVTIHGRITVETFLKDFDWEHTFVFGEPESPPAIPPRRAVDVLVAEEFGPTNLRAIGGIDRSVVLSTPDRQGDFAVIAPLSGVLWTQHRVPLGLPVDRVDGTPLGTRQTVTATAPGKSGVERDRFAPGSFITLTKAQALASPTYDLLDAGIRVSAGSTLSGPDDDASSAPEILRKVRGEFRFSSLGLLLIASAFPEGVLGMVAQRDRPAVMVDVDVRVTVTPPPWVTTADGAHHSSATAAICRSLIVGGAALTAADAAHPVALGGL
ncbi:DUF6603 domain-containing protein [Tessaracoccus antarcticus]|uniref:DUF6603 domain-containing protein n=1 Tax=Tessaracoccus antarcticus TaxID=2479848 RepID=A0A3M0G8Z1_9ACTN|nr:DUF6603 domain-containing protein [Tessaracoccus antarcticus]RMB61510.1 hypothetical protein EAX62_02385 [Tessaracoccus antarcticus]